MSSQAATCSASPRPAPARPPPSRCRSCIASGRTAAAPGPQSCRALVLTPTRELASQIAESFRTYGRAHGLSAMTVFGGVAHQPQIARADRAASTSSSPRPAACSTSSTRATSPLDGVEILVLDEADQMLDMGFIHAIRKHRRRRCRSSARRCSSRRPCRARSRELADELLQRSGQGLGRARRDHRRARRPARASSSTAAQSGRCWPICSQTRRWRARSSSRAPSTAPTASSSTSTTRGIRAEAIHGNKCQSQRERALADFKRGTVRVLVATDIAARGIDVDGVIARHQLRPAERARDLRPPHRPHRARRREGIAISLLRRRGARFLRDIEKLIRMNLPTSGSIQPGPALAAAEHRPARSRSLNGHRQARPRHHGQGREQASTAPHRGATHGGDHHGGRKAGGPGHQSERHAHGQARSAHGGAPAQGHGPSRAGQRQAQAGHGQARPMQGRPPQKRPRFRPQAGGGR